MEKKNLDRLFQEQFRDFEVAPPDHVWPAIEAELTRKKKRRVIPLWYKLSGVAALLVIGLGIFATMNSGSVNGDGVVSAPSGTNDKNAPAVEGVKTNNIPAVVANDPSENASDVNQNKSVVVQSGSSESTSTLNQNPSFGGKSVSDETGNKNPSSVKTRIKNNPSKSAIVSIDASQKNDSKTGVPSTTKREKQTSQTGVAVITESPSEQKQNTIGAEDALQQSVIKSVKVEPRVSSEGIAQSPNKTPSDTKNTQADKQPLNINPVSEQNAVVQVQKTETQPDSTAIATVEPNALEELLNEKENNVTAGEQKINRWQVTSSVAPIYFSSVSNGSPIDSRLSSTNKTYKPSVSYGAGVSYAVSKKLSVRAGVNSLAFEYSTNDLIFYQTQNARQLENVKANAPGSLIEIDRNPGMITAANAEAKNVGKRFDGVLNQRTGYVEVPMEMTYRLLDRKFGLNLIGGVSTLFLNENSVSLEAPGMELVIGEADNLNRIHFSTNVGVGFNYKFLKSFEARFDPMFKYQINTYSNNAGNFKPYFFGLYTGISYRF